MPADAPPRGLDACSRGHPLRRELLVERAGSPKFPHRPSCRPAHAPSTPDRSDGTRLVAPPNAATGRGTAVALSMDFRGSIAWLDGLLSTLQSADLAPARCKTRFRVRGYALSGGLRTHWVCGERFQLRVSLTYLSPFASLLGAIPVSLLVSLLRFISCPARDHR